MRKILDTLRLFKNDRRKTFPCWVVAIWGLILVVQGSLTVLSWEDKGIIENFFETGGPVRIVNGFMWIIIAFSVVTYCSDRDE